MTWPQDILSTQAFHLRRILTHTPEGALPLEHLVREVVQLYGKKVADQIESPPQFFKGVAQRDDERLMQFYYGLGENTLKTPEKVREYLELVSGRVDSSCARKYTLLVEASLGALPEEFDWFKHRLVLKVSGTYRQVNQLLEREKDRLGYVRELDLSGNGFAAAPPIVHKLRLDAIRL